MWCTTSLPAVGVSENSPRAFTIPSSTAKYCWKTGVTLVPCQDGCSGTRSARQRKPSARPPLLRVRGRAKVGPRQHKAPDGNAAIRSVAQHRVANIPSWGWDVAAWRLLGYLLALLGGGLYCFSVHRLP